MSGSKCVYLNVRGAVNNYDELKVMIKNLNPAMILLSGLLVEDIENSEVNIKSFNIVRCDSYSTKTGGVAMYIKRNISYQVIHNEAFKKNAWLLAIKVKSKVFDGNLVVVYHSPSQTDAEFVRYFQEWCEGNLNEEELNIITGDFNLDLLSGSFYSDKIRNVINSLGLKQLVNTPTRIVERSRTLIDYVISNHYKLKVNVLLDEKISDHSTIVIDLNKRFKDESKVSYKTKIVNYSTEKFTDNLLSVNWSESYGMNVNDKANFLVNNLKNCFSEFIQTVRVNDNNKD